MKVIIAGSRGITVGWYVEAAIRESGFIITEIVSGRARGVDRLGEQWALRNNIPLKLFTANWNEYGKSAGSIRNTEMANYADGLIAIWDGRSLGTHNMIKQALKRKLKLSIYMLGPPTKLLPDVTTGDYS
jgi:hypothetical protein